MGRDPESLVARRGRADGGQRRRPTGAVPDRLRRREAGLEDRRAGPKRPAWNRIPDEVRAEIIEMALERPELSPRELAVTFTDERQYFVSEASVYRLLRARGLITSPAHIVLKAADEFKDKTTAPNQLWQTDFTYLKVTGWGWFYLSTILDDFSRYIVAWKLCATMKADDVTDTLEMALAAAGLDCFQTEPGGNPAFAARDAIFMMPHVGSATVRTTIDAIEASMKAGHTDSRNTLQHLINVHPDDMKRIGEMQIGVNLTPIWATDWSDNIPQAVEKLGQHRLETEYQQIKQAFDQLPSLEEVFASGE